MSPFTYIYLRTKEIWHSYFDRMVESAWIRAKQRKESERQNSMVKDKIDKIESYVYNTFNHNNNSAFGNNLSNIYSPGIQTLSLGTGPITLNQGVISMSSESTSLNFTVHTAAGGKVIEYRTSSGQSKLYIVPEGADLGQEIGKIITLEILRA